MSRRTPMRNLSDKELDAVCGGHGVRTGSVFAIQKNTAIVVLSAGVSIIQGNNINTGVQV
jgi:hypothetical protein